MPRPEDPRLTLLLAALDEAFDRPSWHGPNLRGAVRGLAAADAAWRPAPGAHNAWELALHTAYWKHVARRRLTGDRTAFPLPGRNFFERPVDGDASEPAWRADRELLAERHRALRDAVTALQARDLDGPAGARRIRLVRGVAAHDLYHAGQIQLVRRLSASK
jgi:hypothetical protein